MVWCWGGGGVVVVLVVCLYKFLVAPFSAWQKGGEAQSEKRAGKKAEKKLKTYQTYLFSRWESGGSILHISRMSVVFPPV